MKQFIYFLLLSALCWSCYKVELPVSDQPPVVTLTANNTAVANGTYILKAEAKSAYGGAALQKVEFYKGDQKIGESSVAPYSYNYTVTENIPGQQLDFYALITDKAGNQVKSNVVTAQVTVLPIRIEAENATLQGLAKMANDPATQSTSSNGAKVGAIDNAQSGIDITINILSAGTYIIRVAAGTGFDGTSHKLYVDDNVATAIVYNIPNRGWNVWQTFDIPVNLSTGNHKISIRHNTMYGELDYIEYSKQ